MTDLTTDEQALLHRLVALGFMSPGLMTETETTAIQTLHDLGLARLVVERRAVWRATDAGRETERVLR